MPFKSGFVAIIGRPNVGKSTFLNALIGEKVSIVSERPQTTRNVIRGIKNLPDAQVVFLDTPGIHRARDPLNKYMVDAALATLKEVDVVVCMVEAGKPVSEAGDYVFAALKDSGAPAILAINKIDTIERDRLLPLIAEYAAMHEFEHIVPISSTRKIGIDAVLSCVLALLPEGPKYFPDENITDLPERFIVAEIIREKVFKYTREEVPYSTAVVVESFKEKPERNLISIGAVINVERESQKGILIGKKGEMLKRIGKAARLDIEALLGAKVFLELFVRVHKDWSRNEGALRDYGYE